MLLRQREKIRSMLCAEINNCMNLHTGQFPDYRPRRLRSSAALRNLVCETRLSVEQRVLPLFVRSGKKLRREIGAMCGDV